MSARALLRELFLAAEADAINSYTMWTRQAWVFNDAVWREEDEQFPMFKRARIFLELKPFKYRGPEFPREGRPQG